VSVPILEVQRAGQRFVTSTDWLESRHCFSFGTHYDPDNVGHGRLLVNNEDVLISGSGFDDHPHRDVEIVTWVLSGSLVHEDTYGHHGLVYPGLAQRMSAGRGIVHSERNDAFRLDPERLAEPVHFVQMWLLPDENGLPPSYMQRELDLADLSSGWTPVASGSEPDAAVTVGLRGATLWVTILAPGVSRQLPGGSLVHVYVARGEVNLETVGRLATGDSVRVTGAAALRVTGTEDSELLVWQLSS
jgi:redox-sensitive bicupin YhaK (pirin superfamily)